MRLLLRPLAPPLLGTYKAGLDIWGSQCPTGVDRVILWQKIDAMQSGRCAYCESDYSDYRHLEHFRCRDRFPAQTFVWDNLFGSCNTDDTCGTHKDRGGRPYDPADLLKPDVDDPVDYFIFASDGGLHFREELTDGDKWRATETIRVFNLDSPYGDLRARRREAIRPYLKVISDLHDMRAEITDQEALDLISQELAGCIGAAHEGAIRQALLGSGN